VDHYLRDLGPSGLPPAGPQLLEQSVAPDGGKHISLAEPADMHRSLLRLLQQPQVLCWTPLLAPRLSFAGHGQVDAASFLSKTVACCDQDPPDGVVPQPAAAAGHPVVERSSQLLRFYRTLARSEAVCTRELLARRKLLPGGDHSQHRKQVPRFLHGYTGSLSTSTSRSKHTNLSRSASAVLF